MEETKTYRIYYKKDETWHYLTTVEATSEQNAIAIIKRLNPKFQNYELKHFNFII